jgi:hypothetical protein
MSAKKTIWDRRDEHRAILERCGDGLHDALRELDKLWKIHEAEFGTDGEYLRDGGFSDAGLKRLRQLFDEGKRNMELARFFGVTDAAIAYQRKRWQQRQAIAA